MAVVINGKTYRNIQEQVEKNKEDIEEIKESLPEEYEAGNGILIHDYTVEIDPQVVDTVQQRSAADALEAQQREEADTVLFDSIEAEALARSQADTAEAEVRLNTDTALNNRINTVANMGKIEAMPTGIYDPESFPAGIPWQAMLQRLVSFMYGDYMGHAYNGIVRFADSDQPVAGLSQAEVLIEILRTGSKETRRAVVQLSSSDLAPYHWIFNTIQWTMHSDPTPKAELTMSDLSSERTIPGLKFATYVVDPTQIHPSQQITENWFRVYFKNGTENNYNVGESFKIFTKFGHGIIAVNWDVIAVVFRQNAASPSGWQVRLGSQGFENVGTTLEDAFNIKFGESNVRGKFTVTGTDHLFQCTITQVESTESIGAHIIPLGF